MSNKCPACPKEFQSKKKLEQHCVKYHGVKLEDMNEHYFMTRRTVGNLLGMDNRDNSEGKNEKNGRRKPGNCV